MFFSEVWLRVFYHMHELGNWISHFEAYKSLRIHYTSSSFNIRKEEYKKKSIYYFKYSMTSFVQKYIFNVCI